jgi:hypothetical protein
MDYNVETALREFLEHCRKEDWAGYEPYDALNSKIFEALPILDFKLLRLVMTQFLKRSPVNVRGFLLIPKTQNPKGLGLFLSSFLKLAKVGIGVQEGYAEQMIERLIELRSTNRDYWCWGYNFPWQTRGVLVPRWTPNLVCTAFAANALMDAYDQGHGERCFVMAKSAADYIRDVLFWDEGDRAGFSYPLPGLRGTTHNANFLASGLLCRMYKHTGEKKYLDTALTGARFSASKQLEDGSWWYGEHETQRWVDNFHTGFNLTGLRAIDQYAGITEFEERIRRGYKYFKENFYLPDGAVKYFHDRKYPLDTHCVAQSIITPLEFKDLEPNPLGLARPVFNWGMKHMWDKKDHYFYYRILRTCTIKTSYMRWTQAWMFLAMSMLLCEEKGVGEPVYAEPAVATVGAR